MSFHPVARRTAATIAAAAAAVALSGCTSLTADAESLGSLDPAESLADFGSAGGTQPAASATLATLDTLPVKGRAPKTGYDRAKFGPSWTDDVRVAGGHNGCDTRNDILARDLVDETFKPGTRDCVVATGVLDDPYTGTRIDFVRGQTTSTAVQIDHVVALSDAWQKGAQQLDDATRRDLANDPRNLLAVDGPTNGSKSDGDAATWLPPNRSYRCTYVTKQVEVKAAYGLWVTQAEKDAIVTQLATC